MKRIICVITALLTVLTSALTAAAAEYGGAVTAAEAEITETAIGEEEQAPAGEEPKPAIPEITSVSPVSGGLKLSFTGFEGAYGYRVFVRRDDNSGWKKLGDTTALSYTHKNLTAYKNYLYTVRAIDSKGAFVSGYNKDGFAYTYLPNPVLTGASNVFAGPKVTWEAVQGAENYRVYLKTASGWKGIADTAETSYTYPDAVTGTAYTFTVRVYDKENKAPLSYFDKTGVKTAYTAAPSITSFSPADGGTKVSWNAVSGVSKYRLFIRKADDSGWKKVGDTTGTSFTHIDLVGSTEYKYTVRSMDSKGNFLSGYNSKGWAYRYVLPPVMKAATPGDAALTLNWSGSRYASAYRVYRKEFGGEWASIAIVDKTSYTDTTYEAGKVYTYTVRCLGADGKLNSYFNKDNPYYCNGDLADGRLNAGGVTVNFSKGHIRQGFVTIDGKTYYYDSNGTLQKNGVVGSEKDGYRYADKNGVIDAKAFAAPESGGVKWNVLNGKVTKVTTEKDLTLHRALKIACQVTNSSMTKSQKLRAVWNYLTNDCGECSPRADHFDMYWVELYANDMFVNGKGNCFSYAAAFAYLAKAVGYTEVYACNTGGHGWTEIDGLVYDAEWSLHSNKYTYYGMSYYEPCDVPYRVALSLGTSWSHIKV